MLMAPEGEKMVPKIAELVPNIPRYEKTRASPNINRVPRSAKENIGLSGFSSESRPASVPLCSNVFRRLTPQKTARDNRMITGTII